MRATRRAASLVASPFTRRSRSCIAIVVLHYDSRSAIRSRRSSSRRRTRSPYVERVQYVRAGRARRQRRRATPAKGEAEAGATSPSHCSRRAERRRRCRRSRRRRLPAGRRAAWTEAPAWAAAAARRRASSPAMPDPRIERRRERSSIPRTRRRRSANDSAVKAIYLRVQRLRRDRGGGATPGSASRATGRSRRTGRSRASTARKIYLGKFKIPSAVLAALPFHVQGNPGETIADRLATTRALRRHATRTSQRSSTRTSSRPP